MVCTRTQSVGAAFNEPVFIHNLPSVTTA